MIMSVLLVKEMKIPRSDMVSREIYRHFSRKFMMGELGIVESACIASLLVKKQRPVNVIVVAPSGQLKSSIVNDIYRMFPDNVIRIKSRMTPYGVVKEFGEQKLRSHTWIINDMVRTFTGISKIKIEEIVGWLSELMSEGSSGSSTAFASSIENCPMNLIGNIARVSYDSVRDKFMSSTFSERILQFNYVIDKNKIRHGTDKHLPLCRSLLRIKLKSRVFCVPKHHKKKIYGLSDDLTRISHYEKDSMRPDEIVEGFLCGYALLNGRNKLKNSDFMVFGQLLPFFRRIV